MSVFPFLEFFFYFPFELLAVDELRIGAGSVGTLGEEGEECGGGGGGGGGGREGWMSFFLFFAEVSFFVVCRALLNFVRILPKTPSPQKSFPSISAPTKESRDISMRKTISSGTNKVSGSCSKGFFPLILPLL